MMPFQRLQQPSPFKINSAMIFTIILLVVYDVSVALSTSGGGTATIVQAYARPSWYHGSRFVKKCNSCPNGKQQFARGRSCQRACELRCGGIRPRRTSSSLLMATSGSAETVVKNSSAQYHLIWSPNFWRKMVLSMAAWLMIQYASRNNASFTLEKMLFSHGGAACHGQPATTIGGFGRVFQTAVLPLLSSSCCAIQLLINALSGWGCAGFNTYLGPIRPALLPLLLLSTWKLLPERSIGWTIMSLLLAFLPELVDILNTNRSQQWQKDRAIDNDDKEETSSSLTLPVKAKLRLDIPTMGCVACINKIDTSIRQCKSAANIREETSWLTDGAAKGGAAELMILGRTSEEIDVIAKDVVSAVENAGFQCKVELLQVEK